MVFRVNGTKRVAHASQVIVAVIYHQHKEFIWTCEMQTLVTFSGCFLCLPSSSKTNIDSTGYSIADGRLFVSVMDWWPVPVKVCRQLDRKTLNKTKWLQRSDDHLCHSVPFILQFSFQETMLNLNQCILNPSLFPPNLKVFQRHVIVLTAHSVWSLQSFCTEVRIWSKQCFCIFTNNLES